MNNMKSTTDFSIYIDFLNIVDEDTCISMLNSRQNMIECIKNPSEKVQLFCIKSNRYYIRYISNPCIEVQLKAVKNDGTLIRYIKKPNETVQLEAIKQNQHVIMFIKKPCELAQIESCKNISNFHDFMHYSYDYIKSPKALSILYKQAPDIYKEIIQKHKNYKSDAKLILESLK